jgi:hypothetical protein
MSCIPDIKKTIEMHELYKQGFSISQVAKAFGVTRQSVFTRFQRASLETRSKRFLPFIYFNGAKYTKRVNGYYGRTNHDRSFLHRDVWESIKGKIQDGFDIHHIDGDKTNNDLSNLELLLKSEHTKKHHAINTQK